MINRSDPTADDAFVLQLRQCDSRMRALAYSVLGSADQMDDVLHDAYLKAFRARARFRGESSFATWLGAIVHRCCLDHLRRRSRRPADLVDATTFDELAAPGHPEGAADTRLDVAAALQRLTPDHRAIVVLVDLHGTTLADAAGILGVPQGTAASRLNRARAALRSVLSPHHDLPAPEGTR